MPRESKKPRGAVVKEALREAKIKFKTASSDSHFIVKISEDFNLSVQCSDHIFDHDFLRSLRGSQEPSPEHVRLMAQRAEYVAETALLERREIVYIKVETCHSNVDTVH